MKILAPVLFLLACATTSAIAGDPPASPPPPAEPPAAQSVDCSTLEGDARTECEKAKAEAAPKEEKKGKAMKPSNDGRMESYDSDE